MIISRIEGLSKVTPVTVRNIDELTNVVLRDNYCLSSFKSDKRRNEEFESTKAIALDFDGGYPLDKAKLDFAPYTHIIATTRNHQKLKNGVVDDRFRVILFTSEPILNEPTYKATWAALKAKWPECDPACKDPARMYYPSLEIVSFSTEGLRIDPQQQAATTLETPKQVSPVRLIGTLNPRTLKFLLLGAPDGSKHTELYQAARNCHQNGYNETWFLDKLKILSDSVSEPKYLNEGSLKTVSDAFNKDPEFEPNVKQSAFNFRDIGKLYAETKPIEWIVDQQLSKGGLSIFAGPPKSGKSTLVRQLAAEILRGGTFLGDPCVKGDVMYLALEEQDAMLKDDFQRLRVSDKDAIKIHTGGLLSADGVEDLMEAAVQYKPTLIVVDTMLLLCSIKNIADYSEVNGALARLRRISRTSESHILLVHHTSKPSQYGGRAGGSILGSTAIFGAVDYALTLERRGGDRLIHTEGRGTRQYSNRSVLFNSEFRTYSLGGVQDEY